MKRLKGKTSLGYFIPLLLAAWEEQGHSIGVDQHLQLRRLLQNMDDDRPLEEWKTILAPVFSFNEETQEDFYQLFDHILAQNKANLAEHHDRLKDIRGQRIKNTLAAPFRLVKENVSNQWWSIKPWGRAAISSLLIMLSVAWLGHYVYHNYLVQEAPLVEQESTANIAINLDASTPNKTFSFRLIHAKVDYGPIKSIKQIKGKTEHIILRYESSKAQINFYFSGITSGWDKLTYEVCFANKVCEEVNLVFQVEDKSVLPPSAKVINGDFILLFADQSINTDLPSDKDTDATAEQPLADLSQSFSNEAVSFDTIVSGFDPSQKIEGLTSNLRFGGGLAYFSWAKGLFLAVCTLVLLLIAWWLKRRRQKVLLDHQASKNPPYVWTIKIPKLQEVDMGQAFSNTLRAMQQRNELTSVRIDMDQTIDATIKAGGAIDLQYQNLSESRQYLILIDINNQENHQAKILDLFTAELEEHGAPMERFFFDKEPQQFWRAHTGKNFSLAQLQHAYQDYHLVVCSDGQHLSDKLGSFNTWRRKVLLTPSLSSHWSTTEEQLAESFRLLPAIPNGIKALVDTLEAIEPDNYSKQSGLAEAEAIFEPVTVPEFEDGEALISYLASTFDARPDNQDLLRWIAACAIPPSLFWDWTLFVGQELSQPEQNYLTLDNLFQLARLSWFREGKMPDQTRLQLINWLEQHHSHFLLAIRQEWDNILQLEDNLPPLGSIAWEGHRIELVINQLLQNQEWSKRRQLELELERLIHGRENRDVMVVNYLQKRTGALDKMMSHRLRNFVQQKEEFRWRWRPWTWQLPIILVLALASLLLHFGEPVTIFQFKSYVSALNFSPDSKSILVANGDGIAICSVAGNWEQGIDDLDGKVIGLGTHSDGQIIAAATENNTRSYWDISGAPILNDQQNDARVLKAVAFHPTEPFISLLGYSRNTAELWDVRKEELISSFAHPNSVDAVSIFSDGKLLTGSRDGLARLWSPEGEKLVELIGHEGKINTVAISPDGQYLLTGSEDNTAKLWTIAGELVHTFQAHKAGVSDVAFHPNGQQIVTAGKDKKAFLWTIQGEKLRVFDGHRNYITATAIAPNGKYVLTGDRDGKVKLWHLVEE